MSVKIWCESCKGKGDINIQTGWNDEYGFEYIIDSDTCPSCSGLGYIEKGCENCKHNKSIVCAEFVGNIELCAAWEKKNG